MEEQKIVRCAIYTRKSTDEGLEKEFNTLEAQREAGENYIKSLKHQGWVAIPTHYDDGGFSGGNLKRPALKRLLSDVEAGKVDMIVVYKIDRLTRSLLDFSQLVQTFQEHNCSFVSVTQHFNTCDSMGKLTLNILLSFAQFERELGAERVRDKIAASKKKGMWTGGFVPFGYDVKDKKLIINSKEAEAVRFIFETYNRTKSELQTVYDTNLMGYRPKARITKGGSDISTAMFSHAMINKILNNPLYIGKVAYKGELYDGQHQAIISQELWDLTIENRKNNVGNAFQPQRSQKQSLLKGLLECECCGAMTPTRSKRGNKYYEYYTASKQVKEGTEHHHCKIGTIPAAEIDNFVLEKVQKIFKSPDLTNQMLKELEKADPKIGAAEVHKIIENIGEVFEYFEPETIRRFIAEVVIKVIVCKDHVVIKLKPFAANIFENKLLENDPHYIRSSLELSYPVKFGRKRGSMRIVEPELPTKEFPEKDPKLYYAVAQAFYLKQKMEQNNLSLDMLAKKEKLSRGYVGQILRLTILAPDIIAAIINGQQPKLLTLRRLTREKIPYLWEDQKRAFGFN